jgi:type IV secretory pathway VirB2 component (pilin)
VQCQTGNECRVNKPVDGNCFNKEKMAMKPNRQPLNAAKRKQNVRVLYAMGLLLVLPALAHAQGSPFDSGLTSIQTLFTGTVAKVASLVAIVMGGYGFAHGDPGAKKNLAGVAAGTGIAVLAVNVLTWLWGV